MRPGAVPLHGGPFRSMAPFKSRSRRGRYQTKMSNNSMHRANSAPRCKAKSKRTGKPCQAPAVRGYRVCRMHGARGGAPKGKRNGNYRHGGRTKEVIRAVRSINALKRFIG